MLQHQTKHKKASAGCEGEGDMLRPTIKYSVTSKNHKLESAGNHFYINLNTYYKYIYKC